jgi:hypothetical protein
MIKLTFILSRLAELRKGDANNLNCLVYKGYILGENLQGIELFFISKIEKILFHPYNFI